MSLTVKVYLENCADSSATSEIRRFRVDADASTSFIYMQERVAQVFPSIAVQQFTLYWKDEEGEYVTFSSDNELCEALSHMQDDVFRIFVITNNSSLEEDNHFDEITCDGCEAVIRGLRFECTVCLDYDLCEHCKAKGLHKEHEMLRKFEPEAYGTATLPHGAHLNENSANEESFKDRENAKVSESKKVDRDFPFPPDFNDFMLRSMKSFWGPSSKAKQPNDIESDSKDETFEEMRSYFSDCVKTVGENVASMLKPMGIDVDIKVKPAENKKEGENSEKQKTETVVNVPEKTIDGAICGQQKEKSAKASTELPSSLQGQEETRCSPNQPLLNAISCNQREATVSPDANAREQAVDPRVAEFLTRMDAMGFNGEGGWLSQMVLANEQEISKILDVIQDDNHA